METNLSIGSYKDCFGKKRLTKTEILQIRAFGQALHNLKLAKQLRFDEQIANEGCRRLPFCPT